MAAVTSALDASQALLGVGRPSEVLHEAAKKEIDQTRPENAVGIGKHQRQIGEKRLAALTYSFLAPAQKASISASRRRRFNSAAGNADGCGFE